MHKFPLKNVYLVFFAVLIFMLHLPVAFSSTKTTVFNINKPVTEMKEEDNSLSYSDLYSSMKLDMKGLSEKAFVAAMQGFEKLTKAGKIRNQKLITIVDFTKPSTAKRMYVLNVETQEILYHTLVAHGQKSGKEFANQFSNIPESFQSSLGFYETSSTYIGKNGYSMKLKGLENGINNKAEERAVVVHGAPYVSENFIRSNGYLGRSWGCPALPENLNRPIIDKIKNGTCLFIYSEKNNYLDRSKILNS